MVHKFGCWNSKNKTSSKSYQILVAMKYRSYELIVLVLLELIRTIRSSITFIIRFIVSTKNILKNKRIILN